MKRGTKILLLIMMAPVILIGGLYLMGYYYHGQFVKHVAQVKVGLSIAQVEEILPYKYNVYTEQADVVAWADQEVMKDPAPDEIVQSCHLYMFRTASEYHYCAADWVYVYIDPKTQTVKHISLLYW